MGAGPAGLVLGLLLARAGVRVTVLEKHADFLRDFRGDTVHPTTLAMLDDLGLGDRVAALPHSRVVRAAVDTPDGRVVVADLGRLPLRHPYIAMVPQWDLLALLADAAAEEPTFELRVEHEVTGVVRDAGGRVVGVEHRGPDGSGRLGADLVVACDGRWSAVRRAVGLPWTSTRVPFDVWWVRVPTRHRVGESLVPRLLPGRAAVPIPREGYLQLAVLGPKGTDAAVRARGLDAFRAEVAALVPEVADDVTGIASMDDVKHLDVRVDRLRRWHAPGVLCIGDAAHAMSPVGGVGVNLAVQDAVATARLLAPALRRGTLTGRAGDRLLARVRRRRLVPTVVVQAAQRVAHARLIAPALDGRLAAPPRTLVGLLRRFPALTALPAAAVGIGPRPERVPVWARRP